MIGRWHLITGEYPPATGGIARFVSAMAHTLAAHGADVHVWTPSGVAPDRSDGVAVHQLPDRFGSGCEKALLDGVRAMPGRAVLHYAPNALGSRGANLRFCRWYAAQGQRSWDARVLFHEPFMYFGRQSLARNALAALQRMMAAALLRTNHEVYLSTPSWQSLLERYSGRRHRWTWIPITAGDPSRVDGAAVASMRARLADGARILIGTFGTYAHEISDCVRSAVVMTLDACPDARVVCMGVNSREFAASLADGSRVIATGELPEDDLTAAISACDVMLQPFPEGVTCRRTSLLRSLAAGAAVVTTRGRYTEPIWHTSGAVVLADAANPASLGPLVSSLVGDPSRRARLQESARRLYDASFCPAALVAALDPASEPEAVLVGTHTFASTGGGALRQRAALQSLAGLRRARVVALEHADSQMTPHVTGVEHLPVLRHDSVQVTATPGKRKAIASEIFAELADRAIAGGSRYFLFANGDVEISQTVIDRVLLGDRLAYLFWRTDTGADGSKPVVMAEGIDVFVVDARWYKANSWRFRPYIIGERTWDNVYAAILGAEADAAFIAETGWVRHQRHERGWEESPFQAYLQYLSALDHQYFALWCRFWDTVRDAVVRGEAGEIDAAAARTFRRPSGPVRRAVQWGRNVKAVIRYRARTPVRIRLLRT